MWCPRRFREDVECLADAVGAGVDEMKRLAGLPLEVGDVIDGGDDEVDRDEVEVSAVDARKGQNGGKGCGDPPVLEMA